MSRSLLPQSALFSVLFALRDLRKDLALAGSIFGSEASILSLNARTRQLVDEAAPDLPDEDISGPGAPVRRETVPGSWTKSAAIGVGAAAAAQKW